MAHVVDDAEEEYLIQLLKTHVEFFKQTDPQLPEGVRRRINAVQTIVDSHESWDEIENAISTMYNEELAMEPLFEGDELWPRSTADGVVSWPLPNLYVTTTGPMGYLFNDYLISFPTVQTKFTATHRNVAEKKDEYYHCYCDAAAMWIEYLGFVEKLDTGTFIIRDAAPVELVHSALIPNDNPKTKEFDRHMFLTFYHLVDKSLYKIQWLEDMLVCFGPSLSDCQRNCQALFQVEQKPLLRNHVVTTVKQVSWFAGNLAREDAEAHLLYMQRYGMLPIVVRLGREDDRRHLFTVSMLESNSSKFNHVRVSSRGDRRFYFMDVVEPREMVEANDIWTLLIHCSRNLFGAQHPQVQQLVNDYVDHYKTQPTVIQLHPRNDQNQQLEQARQQLQQEMHQVDQDLQQVDQELQQVEDERVQLQQELQQVDQEIRQIRQVRQDEKEDDGQISQDDNEQVQQDFRLEDRSAVHCPIRQPPRQLHSSNLPEFDDHYSPPNR